MQVATAVPAHCVDVWESESVSRGFERWTEQHLTGPNWTCVVPAGSTAPPGVVDAISRWYSLWVAALVDSPVLAWSTVA